MTRSGYDGSINIDSSIDPKGFDKGIDSIMRSVKRLAVAIGVVFSAKVAGGIVKLAAEFQRLELAADAVARMFGYTRAEARSLITELESMGIQTDVANKAFINFAREGLDVNLLPALARGAQDLNVFAEAGATSSDVLDRLMTAVLNLDPLMLRVAGVAVDLGEAYKKYAKANGTAVNQMSIMEKRQAALIAVTEKLSGVTGLYEISQGTLAGQLSSSTRILNQFKAALGGQFTGAVFTVVKAWNDLIKAFTAAIGPGGRLYGLFLNLAAVAQFLGNIIARVISLIGALFGAQIGVATQTTQSMADTTGALASSTGAAADAQGDLADATKKSEKAAKGALAAFDELNVLQQEEPAAGGAGGGGGGGGAIGLPEIEPGPLQKALDAIGERVEAIKARLKPIFDLLAAGVGVFRAALEALKPLGVWLWENFLLPLARWTGGVILRAIEWLTERLNALSDWIKEHPEAFQNIAIFIGIMAAALLIAAAAAGIWAAIGGIAAGITLAFGAAVAFLTSPVTLVILAIGLLIAIIILLVKNWDWVEETALRVWEEIVKKWNTLKDNFRRNVWEPIKKSFSDMWTNVRTWARTTWTNIVTAWRGAGEWFRTKVTDPVKKWFKDTWDNIQDWVEDTWDKVVEIWEGAKQWFTDTVTTPIKDAFDTALDDIRDRWETTWTGIKGFIKNTINGIISLVNGMISAVSTGINAVIGHLNAIKVTVPDWVPGLGGKSWGLNIPRVGTPQVPYLAKGAVIPPGAEFLAVLGDQRGHRNLELPEPLLRQIVREEMGNQGPQEVIIKFEGTLGALVRELRPYIVKEDTRIGGSLIKSGA